MFRNTYQSGFLSILFSCGSAPLELWDMHVKNGYIRRITDEEVKSLALEIAGTNVTTTYIYCPADTKKVLGIKLPFFIMIIKNMKKYFTFEITILDDKNMHRRFRMSNFQSTTRVRPFCTSMPIGLSGGWNQIQFNLADFTRRAYGTNYIETTRVQIHANCRIRRIYFADRLYSEDELPEDFKLFLPLHRKKCVTQVAKELEKKEKIEEVKPPAFEAQEVPQEAPTEEIIETPAEEAPGEPAASEEVHEEPGAKVTEDEAEEEEEEDVSEAAEAAEDEAEEDLREDEEEETIPAQPEEPAGYATEDETEVEQEEEEDAQATEDEAQ